MTINNIYTQFLGQNIDTFHISNLKTEPVGSSEPACNTFFNKELNTHLSSIIKSAGSNEPASYLIQMKGGTLNK